MPRDPKIESAAATAATRLSLLLLCFLLAVDGTMDMRFYNQDSSACQSDNTGTVFTVQGYGPWRAPLPPVTVDPVTKTIRASTFPVLRLQYSVEGTLLNGSACSFCPYSEYPQVVSPDFMWDGGVVYSMTPMYGPCLDGHPSERMACMQNRILFPPDFVGEYFFPQQILSLDNIMFFPYFAHQFLEGKTPSIVSNVEADGLAVKAPTDFALGRGNAIAVMNSFQVQYPNGTTMPAEVIRANYGVDPSTGEERWPMWTQTYCQPACHRNALWARVQVRPEDYLGNPLRSYLARQIPNGNGSGTGPLEVLRCVACPPFTAGYTWGIASGAVPPSSSKYQPYYQIDMPQDPRNLEIWGDCHPWFGSVPVLYYYSATPPSRYKLSGFVLTSHTVDTDGYLYPGTTRSYTVVPCPVNTYNDKCAQYFVYGTPAPSVSGAFQQPQCQPCPPGYHTGGLTGAWFCLPPAGQTMHIDEPQMPTSSYLRDIFNLHVDDQNRSLLWTRRDLLGYQWECGFKAEQCHQCIPLTGNATMTPDEFNQRMILQRLLLWEPCPSGYYCPTALEKPRLCPADFPWSPRGSALQKNCTCAAGTYYSGGVCRTCLPSSTCTANGTYLAGWTRCTQYPGATSGGQCQPCLNGPPSAQYVLGGGIEIVSTSPTGADQYAGACSFDCPLGTQISLNAATCGPATCVPAPSALIASKCQTASNPTGRVFSQELATLKDGFRIKSGVCDKNRATDTLSYRIASIQQVTNLNACPPPVSRTCAEASPTICHGDGSSGTCYVTAQATYYSDYVCGQCPAQLPPATYDITTNSPISQASVCMPSCAPNLQYINASTRLCASCAPLDAMCASTFPGNNQHIRAGGCMGGKTPISSNWTEMKKFCFDCNVQPTASGSGSYFDTDQCRVIGCDPVPTTVTVSKTQYIVTECRGLSNLIVGDCPSQCDADSFLQGACNLTTTTACMRCTNFKPGSYRYGSCSTFTDAQWQICGAPIDNAQVFIPGQYCTGDLGPPSVCPHLKTTVAQGATSASDCVCPAGTIAYGQSGACAPQICESTVSISTRGPGHGLQSPSYSAFSASAGTSMCLACGNGGAFAAGMDRNRFEACVCPAGKYSPSTSTSLDCMPCPARPSASPCPNTGFFGVEDACWKGTLRGSPDACRCIPPPFTLLMADSSSSCVSSAGMCLPDFMVAPWLIRQGITTSAAPGGVPLEVPTGSSLFVKRLETWSVIVDGDRIASSMLASQIPAAAWNITHIATTSDAALSLTGNGTGWGDAYNVQYVVWTIVSNGGGIAVYGLNLPQEQLGGSGRIDLLALWGNGNNNPYDGFDIWIAFPSTDVFTYTVEGLGVAAWLQPQDPSRRSYRSSHPASDTDKVDVAIVVRREETSSLLLALATLQVNYASTIANAQTYPPILTDSNAHIDVQCPPNASIAGGVAHAYLPPNIQIPLGLSGSTFYFAYNAPHSPSGVVAVRVASKAVYRIDLNVGQIQQGATRVDAMALMPSPDGRGVLLYVALDTAENLGAGIVLIPWVTTTPRVITTARQSELTFSGLPAGGSSIHGLSLLWGSAGLNPIFLAIVQPPALDVSSGQGILRGEDGPPRLLYVADTMQRVFTEVQGMPAQTHPFAVAGTGTQIGRAQLVGAYNGSLFSLFVSNCAPMSSGLADPAMARYWDGGQCLKHVCARKRPCGPNQLWNTRQLQCACVPGYYQQTAASDATGAIECALCPKSAQGGYYCPGNGSYVRCPVPSMATPEGGAVAVTDCVCNPGQYYYASSGQCVACPPGSWCPNGWDSILCPGAVDLTRSIAGAQFPTQCVCAPGYTGALCLPCPSGYYCQQSSSLVSNLGLLVYLETTGDGVGAACTSLQGAIQPYLATSKLSFLATPALLSARFLCQLLPAPDGRTGVPMMAALLLQVGTANKDNSVLNGLPSFLNGQHPVDPAFNITGTLPPRSLTVADVQSNTPLQCPTGKSPEPDARITCICASGYATDTANQGCSVCKIGQYKAAAGAGNCVPCPVGTTTLAAGASVCVLPGGGSAGGTPAPAAGAGAGGMNVPLIAGCVGGGIVVVSLIIYGFVLAYS